MRMTLAERIQSRLDALGKNPSAVALEAGLSRSAVRDILMGKVRHSRIDTLKSLTGPLECTLDYLTGETDEPAIDRSSDYWAYDVEAINDPGELEAGVFRPVPDIDFDRKNLSLEAEKAPKRYLKYRDYRFPEQWVRLYRLNDDSMAVGGLLKGDVLTAIQMDDRQIPLTPGSILIIRQHLPSRNVEEWSARRVQIVGSDVHLVCQSTRQIPPIVINSDDLENASTLLANYYFVRPDGNINVEGVVVRATREIATPDIMTEISHNPIDV